MRLPVRAGRGFLRVQHAVEDEPRARLMFREIQGLLVAGLGMYRGTL